MKTFREFVNEAKSTNFSGATLTVGLTTYYVEDAFDPVQTHVIKGISEYDFDEVKERLKALGATKFRKIKGGMGLSSLAFKVK